MDKPPVTPRSRKHRLPRYASPHGIESTPYKRRYDYDSEYLDYPESLGYSDNLSLNNLSGQLEHKRKFLDKEPKTFRGVWVRFAASTSLQGIPFIERAGRWWSRLFWVTVFLGASAACIYQTYEIASSYFAFETTTSVKISYQHLSFPSVTICNLNPIRKSQLHLAPDLQAFVNSLDLPKDYSPDDSESKKRFKRLTSQKNRPDDDFSEDERVLFGTGTVSDASLIAKNLTYLVTSESRATREEMGHKKNFMILSCQFNENVCSEKNFSQIIDTDYGNCFTFNSASQRNISLATYRSGVSHGLSLELFIEDSEYLSGYTIGKGIRVAIHPFNTKAFPGESGISAAPGTDTFIGARLINVTRLGNPYPTCGDNGAYKKFYGERYNLGDCLNTCLDRTISSTCKCYRQEYEQLYTPELLATLPNCYDNTTDETCMDRLIVRESRGELNCGCNPACAASDYNLEISNNVWPDVAYWYTIVDKVCSSGNTAGCTALKDLADSKPQALGNNFLSLKVFYRSLNFESITEHPVYEISQFLSDFGGTIGLWIGASCLTAVELIDLVGQLIHFCYRKSLNRAQEDNQNSKSNDTQLSNGASFRMHTLPVKNANQLGPYSPWKTRH